MKECINCLRKVRDKEHSAEHKVSNATFCER